MAIECALLRGQKLKMSEKTLRQAHTHSLATLCLGLGVAQAA